MQDKYIYIYIYDFNISCSSFSKKKFVLISSTKRKTIVSWLGKKRNKEEKKIKLAKVENS